MRIEWFGEIPIPKLRSVDGWKEILILRRERQRLVDIGLFGDGLTVVPQYFMQGVGGAERDLRAEVLAMDGLKKVVAFLPRNWQLVVWDAYRPVEVQQSLFDGFYRQVKMLHPDFEEAQRLGETQKFVSIPSENTTRPSPHLTGVSVDVTLRVCGQDLWMGTEFDDFSALARADYYEGKQGLGGQELVARRNRRILHHLMVDVGGFSQYVEEWWHYDRGNQFWAASTGRRVALVGI